MKRIICGIVTIALVLSLIPNMGEVKEVEAAVNYNGKKAANYALDWANSFNGSYANYTSQGGDCTNFVSQCLVAGGLPTDYNWSYNNGKSYWTRADWLLEWFKGKPEYSGLIVLDPSYNDIQPGDPIFCIKGQTINNSAYPNDVDHAMICTENNGVPKISQHSDARCNVPYSERVGTGKYFGHAYVVKLHELNSDAESPEISNVKVTMDVDKYIVECDVTDNVGVDRVRFPSWPSYKSSDGCTWYEPTSVNGNHYTFVLRTEEFNYYSGRYLTHIYAYDSAGNQSGTDAKVPAFSQNNFKCCETSMNDHRYELYTCNCSWKDAKSYAENLGGHLVTINSEAENIVIKDLFKSGTLEAYWMGATDESSEGSFKWVTGESFYNYGPGGFDNAGGSENYLGIWNGSWNDFPNDYCNVGRIGYIVEYEPEVTEASGTLNGHEYIVYKDSITATQARAKEGNGYHLATITSVEENNFIMNLAKKLSKQPEGYWFGANDLKYESHFQWETGEPFIYHPWPDGQPDNNGGSAGDENYFGIWASGIWNDFPESYKLGYVLEKDPPASTASGSYNGHDYYVSAEYLTRDEAKALETDGWYLATISSTEERDYIKELINSLSNKNLEGYWLGGSDVVQEGTFVWENGESFTFDNWDSGEPSNNDGMGHDEDYLVIKNSGKYNDISFAYCAGYILERDPESRIIKVDSINLTSNRNETNDAYEGDTFQLTAEVLPEEATDKTVSWSSSDADYAVVDDTGNVTVNSTLPNTIKTITITATSSDGEVIAEYSFVVCPKSSCQHTWDTGNILSDSTCSKNGEMEYTCTKCGTTKIESIGLKQHTEVIDEAIPATCETEGKTEGSHCSVCGKVLTEQTVIPRLQAPEEDQNNSQDETQKAEQKTGQGDNQKTEQKISQDDNQKIEHKNSQDNSQKNDDKTGQNTERKTTLDEVQMSTPTADEQISVPTEELQNDNTVSYSNEWVNGVWYDENGNQTYSGTLSWKSNSGGWWVEDSTGWYPVSSWQKIDGEWYYFTSSGYMASGEYYNGYWFNSDGTMSNDYYLNWKSNSTGWWVEDKSGWWPSGSWLKINGGWYYFDSDGYMVTNKKIDGYWIGADGVCQ